MQYSPSPQRHRRRGRRTTSVPLATARDTKPAQGLGATPYHCESGDVDSREDLEFGRLLSSNVIPPPAQVSGSLRRRTCRPIGNPQIHAHPPAGGVEDSGAESVVDRWMTPQVDLIDHSEIDSAHDLVLSAHDRSVADVQHVHHPNDDPVETELGTLCDVVSILFSLFGLIRRGPSCRWTASTVLRDRGGRRFSLSLKICW